MINFVVGGSLSGDSFFKGSGERQCGNAEGVIGRVHCAVLPELLAE